jgi:hypothetical protein
MHYFRIKITSSPLTWIFHLESAPRSCAEDEGGPLEAGLQEQASNHLKLRW